MPIGGIGKGANPMRRQLVVGFLLLIMAMAGCGDGSNGDDDIASAGGTAEPEADGGTGAEDLSEEERYEMELEFAACMREHGVDVEDPKPGEGIRIQVQGDPAEADAAMEECKRLLPDGGEPPEPDPEERERMLAFAQCMRDNGVEAFEDPKDGAGINIGPEQAEDPDFEAAQEKCNEDVLGGPPETHTSGRQG
jgi:hypothetical protein